MFCANCKKYYKDELANCPYCGTLADHESEIKSYTDHLKATVDHGHAMLWYKCLVYAILWFGVAFNAINGFSALLTKTYTNLIDVVAIETLGPLRAFDMVLGIFVIILGILQFVARGDLARYTVLAPSMLKLCRIYAIALHGIYLLGTSIILLSGGFGGALVSVIFSFRGIAVLLALAYNIFFLIFEKKYFADRSNFFVNN